LNFFCRFVTKVCVVGERIIASASGDGSVRIWDMLNGHQIDCFDLNKIYKNAEELKENPKATVVVMDLAFEPSSKYLFALIEGYDLISTI
jgi:WD40 repeat protein